MTVATNNTNPVLTSLQTLLQPDPDPTTADGGDVQQAAAILSGKVDTSLSLLTSTPSLHSLALEVVANALVFQYTHTRPVTGEGEESLSGQLGQVWQFLDHALSHCPRGWAATLYKWCLKVLSRFTQVHVQSSPATVEEAMSKWLGLSLLAPVFSFLRRCTTILVESGQVEYCLDNLFPLCAPHAPNLSWLLAHIVSQYPSEMMPLLLDHTLSFPYPPALPLSQPTPHSFTSLTQALTFLSRTYRDQLKHATVEALSRILDGGSGSVRMMLIVATHCPPLTKFLAADCLQFITSAKIRSLMTNRDKATPTKESHDSHMTKVEEDQDEGEILSDEEEMDSKSQGGPPYAILEEVVGLVCGLLGHLRGPEAVRALNTVMDVYLHTTSFLRTQEEHVEEGEIVRESPLEAVVEGCRRVMSDFLSRLHSSTSLTQLTPQQGSAGAEVNRVVSVECGLVEWAEKLLDHFRDENNDCRICISWLHEIITCVCTCSSELVAGRLLAHLLLHSNTSDQLSQVLDIYWEIQIRHPHLAESAISAAMGRLQRLSHTASDRGGGLVLSFVKNMLTVLEGMDTSSARQSHTRGAFLSALSLQLLNLAQLLPTSLSSNAYPQFLVILRLLRCILIGQSKLASREVSYQSACKLLQVLFSSFFTLLKSSTQTTLKGGQTELAVEMCLGKCRDLIGWCVTKANSDISHPLQTLAHSTIMGSILSEEISCYFSKSKLSQARILDTAPSTLSHPPLLTAGIGLRPSSLYRPKFNSREVRHSGTLSSRRTGRNHKNDLDEDYIEVAVITNTSHLLQLLLVLTPHDSNQTTSSSLSNATTALGPTQWSGIEGLAHIFMDAVAPTSGVELVQWPEEDSLKYTLEYDLTIKRKFDETPILWHFLVLFSEQNGRSRPLVICGSLIRSLLTMLSQHWQRCRSDSVSLFPWELENSVLLVECLAKAGWIPAPLSFVGELFPAVSTGEVYLLLAAVHTFLKENFKQILSGAPINSCKDTGYKEVIKSTLLNNISRLGHLYPRYNEYCSEHNGIDN
ncbi:integrator complex subunit 5-like [Halichondria panicea]|uniref:integrator complex subunit 5-like n=1 Tax=Halichondria panicea TaxID=6063 RepID=UPI00312BC63E